MRKSEEMFDLIIKIAQKDDNIRSVIMNGSRANPTLKKDIYQDYDICYIVLDVNKYDDSFIDNFGKIGIIQKPDESDFYLNGNQIPIESKTWLVLFDDFNRIDLHICTLKEYEKDGYSDSLMVVLLDKDNVIKQTNSNETSHYIKKINEKQFECICNEFYWCLQNVGKGLARNQLPYAYQMYEEIVKKQLNKILEQYIGIKYEYQVNVGKYGKYYELYLEKDIYNLYKNSYSDLDGNNLWLAIDNGIRLFSLLAKKISHELNYQYNQEEEDFLIKYLKWTKEKK